MNLEFKRDPYLLGWATVLVLVAGALVWHGDVTWKEAIGGVALALGAPAVVGKKADDERPTPLPKIGGDS